MSPEIPYDQWNPLSLAEVAQTFAEAPFTWGLAGGYCVEQFLGRSIRLHGDIDVVVYRDEQLPVQQWLADWHLYAADPPGVLRRWHIGEFLSYGIHDIWGHRTGSAAWQLQIMLAEADGGDWFSRRSAQIRGRRTDLIVHYHGLPCLRIEVQLLYKAKGHRPKDELDFHACLPLLNPAAKCWLEENLRLLYPDGHPWLNALIVQ